MESVTVMKSLEIISNISVLWSILPYFRSMFWFCGQQLYFYPNWIQDQWMGFGSSWGLVESCYVNLEKCFL